MPLPVRRRVASLAITAMASLSLTATGQPASAGSGTPAGPVPTVRDDVRHDTSPPLHTLRGKPSTESYQDRGARGVPATTGPGGSDPVRQASAPRSSVAAATVGVNRDGVGQAFSGPQGTFAVGGAPPDPNLAVGKNQVVQMVNTSFAIFDKTGNVQYGPVTNNTLFTGFGGLCETTNRGDPIVRYDGFADRWVMSQFAFTSTTSGPYFECVAVSQTPDALGSWYRYAFGYSVFPDYPKLGVWPDAYYVTHNRFRLVNGSLTFDGVETCALDRAAMLGGTPATQQCFTTSTAFDSLLPADADGAEPPPPGAPNLQLSLSNTGSALLYWKFQVNWDSPASTTFTGPSTLAVAAYAEACPGPLPFPNSCIPQPGSTPPQAGVLAALSDRLMFRLAYRNFGSHESLVVNHSVVAGSSVGVRWYELRLVAGNPTVHQQSTYAPDGTFRWMGSIAMDKVGNMALGHSASSLAINPEIRITGRLAADPLNTMTQAETTIVPGGGVQNFLLAPHRWGDYSSMDVDPVDGCTFWYTNEYIPFTSVFGEPNWRTRIASFTLPGCSGTARRFAVSSSTSFDLEPVPTGTFLTIYTAVPVTSESQTFAYPWPHTTSGGLYVQTSSCLLDNGLGRLPILYVGPAFGGTQINLYYPNDYSGGANTEPFGACPNPKLNRLTLHPAASFGADIRRPVVLTAARPGFFLDFSTPNAPSGFHYNPTTLASTSFAECNADTTGTKCPVSTGGNPNYLIAYLGGAEKFGCADPGAPCTPPLSGISIALAPPGGGYTSQAVEFYGWAGFLGQEQSNVRILAGTTPGPNRVRVTVPGTLPQSTQELTVKLGVPNG